MIHTLAQFREYAQNAPSLPLDQNRAEVRMYAAVTAILLVLLMVEPTVYLLSVPESVYARTMTISRVSFHVIAAIHLALVLAALPHLTDLMWRPHRLGQLWPRAVACVAAFFAACMWLYAATMAYPLDYGLAWLAYFVRAVVLGGIAFILGWSVNAQHLREAADAPR